MNFSVFMEPNASVNRDDGPRMRILPMQEAITSARRGLSLNVAITDTSVEDDHVVYHCEVSNAINTESWTVSHRYNEFDAFKNDITESALCTSSKCCGACEAVRDYLAACFPKKRLLWSTSQDAIEERTQKFESMLLHLLRCVLLPGKVMKCLSARQHLPPKLYEFLGVQNPLHRRSVLQIFVDNYQSNLSSHLMTFQSKSDGYDNSHCSICMEDVDACENPLMTLSHSVKQTDLTDETKVVALPCSHIFHRGCVFEWLLFQSHCPLCRARIGQSTTSGVFSCRSKKADPWDRNTSKEEP